MLRRSARPTVHALAAATLLAALGCRSTGQDTGDTTPAYSLPPSATANAEEDPIALLTRHHYGRWDRIDQRQQLVGRAMRNEPVRARLVAEVLAEVEAGDKTMRRGGHYRALRDLRAVPEAPAEPGTLDAELTDAQRIAQDIFLIYATFLAHDDVRRGQDERGRAPCRPTTCSLLSPTTPTPASPPPACSTARHSPATARRSAE
ncbi:MAG: hypothetical protein ACIAXF_05095 [Phycisphaerales bacterium JB063]